MIDPMHILILCAKKGGLILKEMQVVAVGADARLRAAAQTLENAGMAVSFFENDVRLFSSADAVLLPLPMSRDGIHVRDTSLEIQTILDAVGEDVPIFAGKTDGITDARLVDYAKDDFFEQMNAPPTAEGALAIVLSETAITVCGMRVGILGFGRVARAVAYLFRAVGADVTVFVRREEARASAELAGYRGVSLTSLAETVCEMDTVINTIPHRIVTGEVISRMEKDTLIVDLASVPGGVDFDLAREAGIRAIHALALPGKYSPKTAGAIIGETVLSLLSQRKHRGEDRL